MSPRCFDCEIALHSVDDVDGGVDRILQSGATQSAQLSSVGQRERERCGADRSIAQLISISPAVASLPAVSKPARRNQDE